MTTNTGSFCAHRLYSHEHPRRRRRSASFLPASRIFALEFSHTWNLTSRRHHWDALTMQPSRTRGLPSNWLGGTALIDNECLAAGPDRLQASFMVSVVKCYSFVPTESWLLVAKLQLSTCNVVGACSVSSFFWSSRAKRRVRRRTHNEQEVMDASLSLSPPPRNNN